MLPLSYIFFSKQTSYTPAKFMGGQATLLGKVPENIKAALYSLPLPLAG